MGGYPTCTRAGCGTKDDGTALREEYLFVRLSPSLSYRIHTYVNWATGKHSRTLRSTVRLVALQNTDRVAAVCIQRGVISLALRDTGEETIGRLVQNSEYRIYRTCSKGSDLMLRTMVLFYVSYCTVNTVKYTRCISRTAQDGSSVPL